MIKKRYIDLGSLHLEKLCTIAYEHNENATYTHEKVMNPIVLNSLKKHHQVKNNQCYDALAIMNPSFLTSTPRPSQA